jgi:hypothetical protein
MYARVAKFDGAEPEAVRRSAEDMNARSATGPPEGVPSVGFLLLIDPENGRSLAVGLFETEDDLRKGDEALNAMNLPGEDMGRRSSVEMYEVAVDRRLSQSPS